MLDSAQANKQRVKDHLEIEYYNLYNSTPQQYSALKSAEKEQNYQLEYMRLYIANVVLTQQLRELLQEKSELVQRVSKLESRKSNYQKDFESQPCDDSYEERKRRLRRPACEISRHYQCPDQQCQKSYGSEGSLNQHMKLKHPHLLLQRDANYSDMGYSQEDKENLQHQHTQKRQKK